MGVHKTIKSLIPNTITLLNLVNGFVALIFAVEEAYRLAAMLVLLGVLLDFADGFAARALKAGSALGRELDSLNDLLCFAVVPALLLYAMLAGRIDGSTESAVNQITGGMARGLHTGSLLSGSWLRFLPVLLVLAGAYRLARFNLAKDGGSFRGLPVPAAGIYVAGLILTVAGAGIGNGIKEADTTAEYMAYLTGSPVFVIGSILVLAVLMVSNVSLISMKMTHYRIRSNGHRYLLLGVSLVMLIFLKWAALPLIIIVYLVFSLAMYLTPKGKNQRNEPEKSRSTT